MNKPIPALICALALLLTGCSSMLNREYSSSSPHVEYPVSDDSTVLQADNYQGLVNAILYFVTEHEESGLIHLSNYTGDIDAALASACHEVLTEDPLGSYAVEEFSHDYTLTSTYYEVTISMTYAHTPEEVAAIVPAAGSTAIRQTISSAMAAFAPQCVLRVSYLTGDEESIKQLARQTYLDTPLAALSMPEVNVNLYPNSGTSRIVELTFDWPLPTEDLMAQSTALEQNALTLLEGLPEELTLEDLLDALRPARIYVPRGGNTAYAALVDGSANDQGVALALRLLCQLVDFEATLAEGTLDGAPRFWLIVSTPEGYRHLDPTAAEPVYATDDDFLAAGYAWPEGRYPDCTDYTAAIQAGENEDPENVKDGETLVDNGADEDPEAPGNGTEPAENEE